MRTELSQTPKLTGPRGTRALPLFVAAALILGLAGSAQALPVIQGTNGTGAIVLTPLVNPDFEDGLNGWTIFLTPNGVAGDVNVVPFVTTPGGSSSNAAQFNVGQDLRTDNFDFQGGGLLQELQLFEGSLFISADIAVFKDPTPGIPPEFDDNLEGGRFEILVDGMVIESFDFGVIFANIIHFDDDFEASFSALIPITTGLHTVAFRMTRPFLNDLGAPGSPTPRQYLDNIILSNSTTDIPEPRTAVLLGLALIGFALRRSPALARS